ncbi:2-succinyl-5-enolpyruvyl-6-hydroxy-3-cyclohexene-1-carboxylic-acid synthase [Mangrovibacillus cuniculi]|uniref:2-succinyl-5-enolpyruvyl-6-hydroxy-3-cyclohexene-1-carboxylate synthase n=1 Tax=Mangrovibacillus cuniculi TaxID=2593652 RepID=A0A7S8CC88_9BACI|nr:2-succinyl-5-enolpyruvyl-6-hydroxy-3-cyclohexene-1-carboxylic-acid synthase [Mangrovibacillus cuniculi]QPC47319.1 2-succinyl-5-enolpyruvyl-6-hydroxy-3-cyclohexene-1-carboxylic-acid synthase [Mangrovibacillus cuniculi]
MKNPILTTYVESFTNGLIQAGLTDIVVSPGSRSTPLAYWFAEHPKLKIHIQVDERSAGFFALGLAKTKGRAVALLCTSGTAAANYFPAIVEANISRVPLVVLTADRPHELRDVGAPQSIQQVNLFGNHVKWATDLPIADGREETNNIALFTASRAMNTSQVSPAGAVHVNIPFREPLIPDLEYVTNNIPIVRDFADTSIQLTSLDQSLQEALEDNSKGIFVCGEKNYSDAEIELLLACAEKFHFAIVADPLSNLRFVKCLKPYIVDRYDWFLRDGRSLEHLQVDCIIRFGAMPVSKVLTQFIQKSTAMYITVDEGQEYRDPTLSTSFVHASMESFLKELLKLEGKANESNPWLIWNEVIHSDIPNEEWSERKIYTFLNETLPNASHVFVGNSMPIREVDLFFSKNGSEKLVFANRGANGIDGVVSSAVGMATCVNPSYLLIGDLSFYHDMNGLLYAKQQQTPLTIIVINNDGGGIFSYLPQGKMEQHYETLFGTPTGIKFKHTAAMYGIPYVKVENYQELEKEIVPIDGPKIVEIVVDRENHVAQHRELWKYVSREIDYLLSDDEC